MQVRLWQLCAALAVLALSSPAWALVPTLDVGAGALVAGNGSFLDEPNDKVVSVNGNNYEAIYPGFGGLGLGGGLALEARFADLIGLEMNLLFTEDVGRGDINGVETTIRQSAVHLPLLLKLSVPSPLIKPNAFVGLEFVFPGDPTIKSERPVFSTLEAENGNYKMLAFGLGMEIAPPIVGIDLRIPVSLRGSMSLDDTGKIEDRVRVIEGGNGEVFDSRWQWHVYATVGVMYYFL
jgi:hypothetical protein